HRTRNIGHHVTGRNESRCIFTVIRLIPCCMFGIANTVATNSVAVDAAVIYAKGPRLSLRSYVRTIRVEVDSFASASEQGELASVDTDARRSLEETLVVEEMEHVKT